MKIDIHTHTKRCKKGDAPTREISPVEFCKAILSTDVRIVAVTNHNTFDHQQFAEIIKRINGEAQVWPGVELDVFEDSIRAHLLVIVSPDQAEVFTVAVNKLTNGKTADDFTCSIEEVLEAFDSFHPLYVAHHAGKKPDLSGQALGKLQESTAFPNRVIKEVTNSISAGIYISHGHPSLFGSDLQDWKDYEKISRDLPDLRLPVDSFDQFCLLLDKDATTINTALDKKSPEELSLFPFGKDEAVLRLKVFNDINVIFGSKGTGKSCILQAIAKYYSDNGTEAKVCEPAGGRLDDIFDTKGKNLTIDLGSHSINYCTKEIEGLRIAVEVKVTSINKYVDHFRAKTTNRNAKKILLKDIAPEDESGPEHEFKEVDVAADKAEQFLNFFNESIAMKKTVADGDYKDLKALLAKVLTQLRDRKWVGFSGWKEIRLLNSAIAKMRTEVERKTGSPSLPTKTGFKDFAINRLKINSNAQEILKNVNTPIPSLKQIVGRLGADKGDLTFQTDFVFQTGDKTDGSRSTFKGVKKGAQKKFVTCVKKIEGNVFSDGLFQSISDLNAVEDGEDIKSLHELILYRRYFALNGESYSPSSGEASMVMLQKELEEEKDVYILDEPERSLGNEYISDVIVPLIKSRAKAGKKVFISTHDANIAVRTLPYSSIFRSHGPGGYSTYVGNPFCNNLTNLENEADSKDWKEVSMRTLEGGSEAFGERGRIYGNA